MTVTLITVPYLQGFYSFIQAFIFKNITKQNIIKSNNDYHTKVSQRIPTGVEEPKKGSRVLRCTHLHTQETHKNNELEATS